MHILQWWYPGAGKRWSFTVWATADSDYATARATTGAQILTGRIGAGTTARPVRR